MTECSGYVMIVNNGKITLQMPWADSHNYCNTVYFDDMNTHIDGDNDEFNTILYNKAKVNVSKNFNDIFGFIKNQSINDYNKYDENIINESLPPSVMDNMSSYINYKKFLNNFPSIADDYLKKTCSALTLKDIL